MGVGAVFISTLALHRLPTPNDPPVTQQDHLSLMLQPIVSFVVLSSIIIREFSLFIFFCFVGLRMERNVTIRRWLVHTILQLGGERIEDAHPVCNLEFHKRVP